MSEAGNKPFNLRKFLAPIQRTLPTLVIVLLFIVIGLSLARFLNWGEINYNYLDWSEEGPRYAYVQNALRQGQLPLFIDSPMAENERFIGIADTLLVPQYVLLFFMSAGQFIVVNTLINYTLGFYLMLLIKKRLNWTLETFLIVTPLVLFNGYILSHLAVGHSMWVNSYLIPWLALLCLDYPEGSINWRWILNFSLYSLLVFLQGGFHFALWSWGFILLFAFTKKSRVKNGVVAFLSGVLISMIRILPTSVTYITSGRRFIAGFRTITDLVMSLAHIQLPEVPDPLLNSGLPVWESNYYIGFLGTAFILIFGLFLPLLKKDLKTQLRLTEFWFPMLIVTVLSIGQIWRFTNYLPIPFAHAERVSARFFYLPMVFLLVIAGQSFHLWQEKLQPVLHKWIVLSSAVIVMMHDLFQHARLWRVDRLDTLFEKLDVPLIADVAIKSDPPYISAIITGMVISTLTLALLIYLAIRQRSKANPKITPL
jgi:hypothetical protein